MKNKFKFLIASVSIAMLFLSSCDKEIYDDAIYQSQQPQNLSISKISFKELKSNKNAVEKIKHVMTKKLPTSIANRAVYNEDFGVLIDTTNIVQMVSETEQSLTFNIVDYTDSTKKENLILEAKAKQTIDDIYQKIQQGEGFESLATQFSEDKSSASKGGVLQRFGSGQLSSEEFENVAFSLQNKNDISKPFQSQFGWHIVKLIDKHPVLSSIMI